MGQRLLPALCGGGMVATRMMGRKVLVRRASRHPSSDSKQLPTAGGARVGGGCKAVKQSAPGGGGYHVNCNGALMVEMAGGGRRVMVVADGRKEAAGALQWALSQVVRSNDTLVLLSVVKPVAHEAVSDSRVKILEPKCSKHIEAMKNICESTRPEVKVETCVVEAEERAPAVVEAARRHGASLLVLGQHRRLGVARWLQALWRRWRRRVGTVDFCIEHAPCVALGVRRRRSGGYLLSSKSHKDFWLLA